MSHHPAAAPGKAVRKRPPRIVLVVACSQRKRVAPPSELRLASIDAATLAQRAAQWGKRLRCVEAAQHPARNLYMGDHWRAACEAHRLAQHYSNRSELWVISAGYGLIPSNKAIKPYSATFATGSSDSVWRGPVDGTRHQRLQDWWRALPHDISLPDLLRANEDGAIVIVAGAAYLTALNADLGNVLAGEAGDDRVSVISAGTRGNGALLPVSGLFRTAVGGTDSSLNARMLELLAAAAPAHGFSRSAMAKILTRMARDVPVVKRRAGRSASDEHILREIRALGRLLPGLSRTQALRAIRTRGTACEQDRFASLWAAHAIATR